MRTMARITHLTLRGLVLLLLIVLPLVGATLAGHDVRRYLEFPPTTRYVEPAAFSWTYFAVLAAFILLIVGPFVAPILTFRQEPPLHAQPRRRFPWWGWAGLALGAVAWGIAWTRIPALSAVQPFTFTPLWLTYILVINAATWKRTGRCMMLHRPRFFLALFPFSAVFWWFFEYLNRFVQNWHYVGVDGLSRLQYIVFATLPFATVLPAVLGTYDLLHTFPGLGNPVRDGCRIRVRHPRVTAGVFFFLSAAGLVGLPTLPNLLFPLLWVSPLFMLASVEAMFGRPSVFTPLRQGHWDRIVLLGLSALCCGFFWEMWNWHSLAKWVYSVPYLNRFRIFEMPVLGYSGYLPFGMECAIIGDMVAELVENVSKRSVHSHSRGSTL